MIFPNFLDAEVSDIPFPHVRFPAVLSDEAADTILEWLDNGAPWMIKHADFYDQMEFSLLTARLPEHLSSLISAEFTGSVAAALRAALSAPSLELVDICAHRLTAGMTIRIHNDYLGAVETHRLLVQLNHGWTSDQGGLLMLFGNDRPDSLADVLLPTHRSGFGFEISPRSHHAVSTIYRGARDTLVYTFRIVT